MIRPFGGASRRQLLKYLAVTGLSSSFFARKLFASTGLPQEKRVVFVYVPGGATPENWMPKGCERTFTLAPVSQPLEPVKHHCVFLDDIVLRDRGPGRTDKTLGGDIHGDTTVDIRLGKHLQGDALYPNLFLSSTDLAESFDVGASKENGEQVPYDFNPLASFERLFADDVRSLPAQVDALRRSFATESADVLGRFDKTTDLNIELTALALHTNKTRVVSLMMGGSNGWFFAPESGFDDTFYTATHSRSSAEYDQFRTYLTTKMLYLLQLLEATPDRHGVSLLDNTLVVQVTDTGFAPAYGEYRPPIMLAGGKSMIHNGLYLREIRDYFSVLDTVTAAVGLPEVVLGAGPLTQLLK